MASLSAVGGQDREGCVIAKRGQIKAHYWAHESQDDCDRVMHPKSEYIEVKHTVATVRRLLEKARGHMDAGRIPILRPETQEGLVEKAKQHEIEQYGQLFLRDANPNKAADRQRGLFD